MLAAYLAEAGLDVSGEILVSIIGVGVAVVLGIAIEDHGRKSHTEVTVVPNPPPDNNGEV